jgi:hypothetical protein
MASEIDQTSGKSGYHIRTEIEANVDMKAIDIEDLVDPPASLPFR